MVKQFQHFGDIDRQIDTSGTRCPIPLLKAKQTLKTMAAGQLLSVISTDPSSIGDFEAMLSHLPHALLEATTDDTSAPTKYHVLIKKG